MGPQYVIVKETKFLRGWSVTTLWCFRPWVVWNPLAIVAGETSSRILKIAKAGSHRAQEVWWGPLIKPPSSQAEQCFVMFCIWDKLYLQQEDGQQLFKGCRPCRRPRKRETGNGVSWLRSSVLWIVSLDALYIHIYIYASNSIYLYVEVKFC